MSNGIGQSAMRPRLTFSGAPSRDVAGSDNEKVMEDSLVRKGDGVIPPVHGAVALTGEQMAAVSANEGLVIVSSGAGTGKTTVLTRRIAALRQSHHTVLALTFTRDAVMEMRQRVEAQGLSAGVVIRTLHSLSGLIIRKAVSLEFHPAWSFFGEDDSRLFLKRLFAERVQTSGVVMSGQEMEAYIDTLAHEAGSAISRWKENGAKPPAPGEEPDDLDDEGRVHLAAYRAIEDHKAREGLLDFGDMAMRASALIQAHPELVRATIGTIGHLLVDEAQDLSMAQIELVNHLSQGACLFLVGDDDQCLYAFRGAVPRLMERAETFFPGPAANGVRRVNLTSNMRCTEQILRPANAVVSLTRRAGPKVLISGRQGPAVGVKGFSTSKKQVMALADEIEALIGEGVEAKRIAVLARARRSLQGLDMALKKRGIPAVMRSGTRFDERQEVCDVLAYMTLAQYPDQREAFLRAVQRPRRGIGPSIAMAVADHDRGEPFHRVIRQFLSADGIKLTASARRGLLGMADVLALLQKAYHSRLSSAQMLSVILIQAGYEKWALQASTTRATALHSFDVMRDMAQEEPVLESFLSLLEGATDMDHPPGEGVVVGTIHGSKGREWDHVYIVGMERDVFPSKSALSGPRAGLTQGQWSLGGRTDIDDERRLFHVAVTRAKSHCTLSHAMQRGGGHQGKDNMPSIFYYEAGLEVPRTALSLIASERRGRK